MEFKNIKVRKVSSTFAAEVTGLDLSGTIDKNDIEDLKTVLDQFGVACLPNQNMTPDQQIKFSEMLGNVEDSDAGSPKYKEMRKELSFNDQRVSEISNLIDGDKILSASDQRRIYQYANQMWHSDSTFRPIRAKYTMLLAIQVPSSGGDTEFADMAGAYDALPDYLKEEIESLQGIHSPYTVMELLGATRKDQGGFTSDLPDQVRPLVEVHPGSGRKVLNIGSHCSHIEDMSIPEGRALLVALRELATEHNLRYRHAWQPGDFVIWDGRSTLHRGCRYKENSEPRQLVRSLVQDD